MLRYIEYVYNYVDLSKCLYLMCIYIYSGVFRFWGLEKGRVRLVWVLLFISFVVGGKLIKIFDV